jgi:acyl-CoA reductase-like NAD-dependent aldehyde dehydrogenase
MSKQENDKSTDVEEIMAVLHIAQEMVEDIEDAIEWARRAQDALDVRSKETHEDRQRYLDRAGECRDKAQDAAEMISINLVILRSFRR